jgi:hypothetical protein
MAGQKEGVLAPDSEFRWIGWAVGTDSILAWFGMGGGLGIRYGGRDGGEGGQGIEPTGVFKSEDGGQDEGEINQKHLLTRAW